MIFPSPTCHIPAVARNRETRAASFERMTARQPIARIGEPPEVAEAYLYLMRGTYTTGQVLLVDGGGPML